MISEPNIIISILDKNENNKYYINDSPIQQINDAFQMEMVKAELSALFQEEPLKKINFSANYQNNEKKKQSVGKRVKHKLERTKNKSLNVVRNLNSISQFGFGNVENNENSDIKQRNNQQISFSSRHKNAKKLFKSVEDIGQTSPPHRQTSIDCLSSLTFQNVSQQTHRSFSNSYEVINEPETPIQSLNNLSRLHSIQNKRKKLNFELSIISELEDVNQKRQLFPNQNIDKEKDVKKQENIDMKNVPLVASLPIFSMLSSIKVRKPETSSFEYVMKQLNELNQNVQSLQLATKQLQNIKNIENPEKNICQKQNRDNNNDSSLYSYFQQNIENSQSFRQPTLILNLSNKSDQKNKEFVYETPSQGWRRQLALNNEQKKSTTNSKKFNLQFSQSIDSKKAKKDSILNKQKGTNFRIYDKSTNQTYLQKKEETEY